MARTNIDATTAVPSYPPTLPVSAGSLTLGLLNTDAANGNKIPWQGQRMVLIFQNTDAAPQTFTITSGKDMFNRSGDITTYSMAAGAIAYFIVDRAGWMQIDGNLYLSTSSNNIKVAAIPI